MPLLKLQTSAILDDKRKSELLAKLSSVLGGALGKPEQYVMVTVDSCAAIMSGEQGPAAFADVRSIGGLGGPANGKIAEQVCAVLHDILGIAPDRVYLNFTNVPARDWGWDSSTFG